MELIVNKKPNIVARTVHDSYFLIDITQSYSDDKCRLYEINEIGNYIWNMIDGKNTASDIAGSIKKAITDDVSIDEILSDVNAFLNSLLKDGFVEGNY